jgi:hypothetical protein
MLQVHAFQLPDHVEKANEFLKTHKPFGDIHFVQDQMLVFVEDGANPPAYQIAELEDLLRAVRASKRQQEVAIAVATDERNSGYLPKNQIQKITNDIISLEEAIKHQESKEKFLLARIEEVRAQK